MSHDEVNDDLALPKKEFKVVACIPVRGRLPLLPFTIGRLLTKNKVSAVICVGETLEEKAVCIEAGALWVQHENKPLGKKWNQAFMAAKALNPDACLYVGSSDWLSDNWLTTMQPYLNHHSMIGIPGMNLADVAYKIRACTWAGYNRRLRDETIGLGRMLSKKLLDKLNWQPFHDDKDNSLDRSMKDRAQAVGVEDYFVIDNTLKALSISCPRWPNKHQFESHWNDPTTNTKIINPEQWCEENFPEILEFHKTVNPVNA